MSALGRPFGRCGGRLVRDTGRGLFEALESYGTDFPAESVPLDFTSPSFAVIRADKAPNDCLLEIPRQFLHVVIIHSTSLPFFRIDSRQLL
jgi:hypothetical protein